MNSKGVDLVEVDPTFADSSSVFDSSKYVIYGVPYDATVSHLSGAAKAPISIRAESYNFETFLMDLDVDLAGISMCDIGNLVVNNSEDGQVKMLQDVETLMEFLLEEKKMPFMMGGEHSITEASVNGFMETYHRRGGIAVIVDAHLDFRDEYLDNPHSHACVTRRLLEKWGNDSIFVIGARSGSKEEFEEAEKLGLRYVTSRQVNGHGITQILDDWDSGYSIRERPTYLSIDIDCLDPSYAPGTGTPEPWGISSVEVLRILEGLYKNTLAMDIMEVTPDIEAHITPGLAGKLIRQMIGLKEMKIDNPTWLEKL
jgi:agmatinase